MELAEARSYIGKRAVITYKDRLDNEIKEEAEITDVVFETMYGSYLVCDYEDEIRLNKILSVVVIEPKEIPAVA